MKTKYYRTKLKCGFTLLEMTVSMAILAMLGTSSMVLVRTSYAAWNRHHQDSVKRQTVAGLMRHVERKVRQARSVQAISPSTDTSGSLSLLMENGEVVVWEHNAATKEVLYGVGSATEVLATGVESLTFRGYTVPFVLSEEEGLIHTIQAFASINLSRPAGISTETWNGSAHIRSW